MNSPFVDPRKDLGSHWNAHNHDECGCDNCPIRCDDCGELYEAGQHHECEDEQ